MSRKDAQTHVTTPDCRAAGCRPSRWPAKWAGRFWRREDGTVTVFAVMMFVLMVGAGGIAIDVMRYETQRTQLQATLDRAVLAAASLSQTRDPETVVRNYFEVAGLQDYRLRVFVEQDENAVVFRRVSAIAEMEIQSIFMHIFGVRALTSPAASAAEERVENIEISLVLDISGSMRNSNRLPDLQEAANNFLTTVFDNGEPSQISVNIVPYAGHVNPGPVMFDYMGGVRRHNDNSCVEFTTADFLNDDLPSGVYEQVPHFMNWSIAWDWMQWGWCPQDNMGIVYANNNLTTLTNFINNIELHDGTATHVGMKYGLALLNPTSQPAFDHLYQQGVITNEEFRHRPAEWGDSGTGKFLVLMTDGEITEQVRPREWDDPDNATIELAFRTGDRINRSSRTENVNSFLDICGVARMQNVVVFTIAFDAPSTAVTQMRNCASSHAHFYDVDGDEIDDAFLSIANAINRLRLTQ